MRYFIFAFSILIPQLLFSNTIIHEDDFNNCGTVSWSAVAGSADTETFDAWQCNTFGGRTYIEIYDGDGNNDDDWLISPSFNLNNYNQEYFSFEFDNASDINGLSLVYSTNYSGANTATAIANATWNTLDLNIFDIDNNSYTSNFSYHQSIDLSSISGTSVYLAFHFTSTSNTQGWSIDNVRLTADYYEDIEAEVAANTRCIDLKSALQELIKGHDKIEYTSSSYDVWDAFFATDKRLNDAGTNTIVYDMYSDNPSGSEPYEFTLGANQDSGTTAGMEGVYYNREHVFAKSWWGGGTSPADTQYTDIHHIVPSDQFVNSLKSNHPMGLTVLPTSTTDNGCKVGNSALFGYTGTIFEPIDTYKGDFARMLLYFTTRYQYNIPSWAASFLNNDIYTSLDPWLLENLICWHELDPVSQKEIDRNNAIYSIQKNRNPFIDHPEYVEFIWGTCGNVACVTVLLPIELTNFEAEALPKEKSLLLWETASEINADYFEIQHSVDGDRFEIIGEVKAQGNSSKMSTYQFTHDKAISGTNYYRFKSFNQDGSYEWSPTITVEHQISTWLEVYPTIVEEEITLISNHSSEQTDVKIYDLQGRMLAEYSFNNLELIHINLEFLNTGMYLLSCQSGSLVETKRIFVK